jgi:hypothetical protein
MALMSERELGFALKGWTAAHERTVAAAALAEPAPLRQIGGE